MVVEGVDVDALIDATVLAEYRERGYRRSPRLFDEHTTARLRSAHERLWGGDFDHPIPSQYGRPGDEPDATAVRQQCNAFWLNDDVRELTTSPLLGAIGARFMGVEEVRLWHDQAVTKPGDTCYRESRQDPPNLLFLGPDARPGQPFAGPYWPLMWPP